MLANQQCLLHSVYMWRKQERTGRPLWSLTTLNTHPQHPPLVLCHLPLWNYPLWHPSPLHHCSYSPKHLSPLPLWTYPLWTYGPIPYQTYHLSDLPPIRLRGLRRPIPYQTYVLWTYPLSDLSSICNSEIAHYIIQ